MNKQKRPKLRLARETVRSLDREQLEQAAGAAELFTSDQYVSRCCPLPRPTLVNYCRPSVNSQCYTKCGWDCPLPPSAQIGCTFIC